MASVLKITSVENLQEEINKTVKSFSETPGIYISLNKTQASIKKTLTESGINSDRLFFIDCVSAEQTKDDVLHVSPSSLDKLADAINDFIKEIPGKKFLLLDALSTLIIYNPENKVASFIKEVVENASKENVDVVAISPSTKGENLLNKIFNFFDEVEKDGPENEEVSYGANEDLIY